MSLNVVQASQETLWQAKHFRANLSRVPASTEHNALLDKNVRFNFTAITSLSKGVRRCQTTEDVARVSTKEIDIQTTTARMHRL